LRAADASAARQLCGGIHGGATFAFADYALCLVAGRAADGGTTPRSP